MSNDPWATQPQTTNPFPQQGQQQAQPTTWPQPGQPAQGQQRGPQPPSLGDALAGGGAQAAFNQKTPVGIVIRGPIASDWNPKTAIQQTRFEPRFFDDGNAKWIIVITIENAEWSQDDVNFQPLRTSQDDDGRRSFYIKNWGNNLKALQEAIKAAGHTEAEKALAPGVLFAGKHTGRQRSSKGGNDELLYAYHIGAVAAGPTGAAPQPAAPQQAAQPQQAPAQQPWPQQQAAQQEEPPF